MAARTEPPSQRDKLLLVRGVNVRMADLLEQSGYGSVEAIAREEDTDRFAIKSGLGAAKAQAVKAAVARFLESEWPPVEARMEQSIAAAQAEQAKLEAEEKAAAELEARTGAEPGVEDVVAAAEETNQG
jgi:endonuclease III